MRRKRVKTYRLPVLCPRCAQQLSCEVFLNLLESTTKEQEGQTEMYHHVYIGRAWCTACGVWSDLKLQVESIGYQTELDF